jgi:CBS domain-containing protein
MNDAVVFVSRVLKLPLLGVDSDPIGRVEDLVVGPSARGGAPPIMGLVATISRRRIFVAATRIADVSPAGVRMRQEAVDLRPFQLRTGELTASSLLDRRHGDEVVVDVGIQPSLRPAGAWEVAVVALGKHGPLRRKSPSRVVPVDEVQELFDTGAMGRDLAALRALHPSDMARAVAKLPAARRQEVAEAMHDEDLADLLEELPEPVQAHIITELGTDRAARVLEEMEPDDAVDLLSELSGTERSQLLEAMHPEEADPLRRLLLFDDHSAGGLMNPEPVVLPPEATVAEALARVRSEDVPSALGACVFVAQPPTQTPTGPYLGVVTFQALLREPPGQQLGLLAAQDTAPIGPELPEVEVAAALAAYNLLALPVCDSEGRLLGAVTVDDVLDRTLPAGWRTR